MGCAQSADRADWKNTQQSTKADLRDDLGEFGEKKAVKIIGPPELRLHEHQKCRDQALVHLGMAG